MTPRSSGGPTARTRRGRYAQQAARSLFEDAGLSIVEENYRCRWGELDIVARENDVLVFVEVRSHTVSAFGTPEESITSKKTTRLRLLADHYRSTRIAVVAVDLTPRGDVTEIRVVENAVEGE